MEFFILRRVACASNGAFLMPHTHLEMEPLFWRAFKDQVNSNMHIEQSFSFSIFIMVNLHAWFSIFFSLVFFPNAIFLDIPVSLFNSVIFFEFSLTKSFLILSHKDIPVSCFLMLQCNFLRIFPHTIFPLLSHIETIHHFIGIQLLYLVVSLSLMYVESDFPPILLLSCGLLV